MELKEFCQKLATLKDLKLAQKAIAILWFIEHSTPGILKSGNELATIMRSSGIGNPNTTELNNRIIKTGCVFRTGTNFRVKENKKAEVRSWIESILVGQSREIEIEYQFLPETIWKNTRGYIEKICKQINGCFFEGFFDGAAVLIRRLIETLIIECFEFKKRANEIKDAENHFFMLSSLIDKTLSKDGLNIGRETEKALKNIKTLGDRSAHNRHYNAKKIDIDKIRDDLRISVEELINIANLYTK